MLICNAFEYPSMYHTKQCIHMSFCVACWSFNVVYEMVPENLHKLFNNMRKSDERKERQKVASSTTEQDISIEGSRKRKSET